MKGDRVEQANFLVDQMIFVITMDGVVGEAFHGLSYKIKMMELVKVLVLLRRVINGEYDDKQKVEPLLMLGDGKNKYGRGSTQMGS